jgi:hypothetical protein
VALRHTDGPAIGFPAPGCTQPTPLYGLARTPGNGGFLRRRQEPLRSAGVQQPSQSWLPRGPRREPSPANRSPESLNGRLRESAKAFSVPHRNPTSPRPGPSPRDPHGHDGIPRHTPALMLKLRRKRPLNRRNAGAAGCRPCRSVVVRDRIELSTFRFSGGRSYRLSYLTRLGYPVNLTRQPCGPDGI